MITRSLVFNMGMVTHNCPYNYLYYGPQFPGGLKQFSYFAPMP